MIKANYKIPFLIYWIFVILLFPVLIIPLVDYVWMLILVPFLVGFGKVSSQNKTSPFVFPILLLLVMVLVSLHFTYDVQVSLSKITGVIFGFLVFWGIHCYSKDYGIFYFYLTVFLLLGFFMSLVSLFFTQFPTVKFDFLNPITAALPQFIMFSNLINSNEVAGMMLWLLPVNFSLFVYFLFSLPYQVKQQKKKNLSNRFLFWLKQVGIISLLFISLSLLTFVVVLVQSRAAYFVLAITIIGMACIWFLFSYGFKKKWILLFLFGLLILIMVSLFNEQIFGLFGKIYHYLPTDNEFSLRPRIWSSAIYMIKDFPLTGMGMNTYRSMVHYVNPLYLASGYKDFGHAHNEFLQVSLDLGLPGLIAFVSIYILAFYMLFQLFKRSNQYPEDPFPLKAVVLGLGGGLLAHLLWGMVDAISLGAKPGFIFWMLLGLISALYQIYFGKQSETSGVLHAG